MLKVTVERWHLRHTVGIFESWAAASTPVDSRPAQAHNRGGGQRSLERSHLMKYPLLAPLFLGVLMLALSAIVNCGGGGNDEDEVRDTIREVVTAINDQDAEKLSQLVTANLFGVEPTPEALEDLLGAFFKIENLEIVSVTADGDRATAEITRTEDGATVREIMSLVKVDGRWRLDNVDGNGDEDLEGEPGVAVTPGEEPGARELTPEEELLASLVLTEEEVGEVFPGQEWRVFSQPEEFFGEEPPLGQVASLVAFYEPQQVADVFEVSTLLLLFETAEDAGKQFQEMSRLALEGGPGVEIEQFDAAGIGDEAHGQVNRTPEVYTSVLLRVDRVVVDISLPLGLTDEDMRDAARQLAQKLAEKIQASLEG